MVCVCVNTHSLQSPACYEFCFHHTLPRLKTTAMLWQRPCTHAPSPGWCSRSTLVPTLESTSPGSLVYWIYSVLRTSRYVLYQSSGCILCLFTTSQLCPALRIYICMYVCMYVCMLFMDTPFVSGVAAHVPLRSICVHRLTHLSSYASTTPTRNCTSSSTTTCLPLNKPL